MKLFVLVTDGTNSLMVSQPDNPTATLPSYKIWPVTKKARKMNWPLALIKHITYDLPFNWPDYIRPKKAFGLPEKSGWAIFKLEQKQFKSLLKLCKITSSWWHRNASAKLPWKLKSVKMNSATLACDPCGAHCIREFLKHHND